MVDSRNWLTPEERDKIDRVTIGIAGAGGLGSNVAAHLVRSGVLSLVIADFDVVTTGNLNRQFYFADQVGRRKVEALAENLRRINPEVRLELHPARVGEAEALRWFQHCDIVVEAFDAAAEKARLIRTLASTGKTIVAASGMAGWGRSGAMRVRPVGQQLYLAGDLASGVDSGNAPVSPRVGIAAALQANTVMALILGVEV